MSHIRFSGPSRLLTWSQQCLPLLSHSLHRFELSIGHSWPQDVLDGDDIVVLEVFEDLQFPEGPFGIGHHVKSIGYLLDGHLLA